MKTRTLATAAAAVAVALALAGCGDDSKTREDPVIPGGSSTTDATSPTTAPDGENTDSDGDATGSGGDGTEAGAATGNEKEILDRTIDYMWDGVSSYQQVGEMEFTLEISGETIDTVMNFTSHYIPEPLQMDMNITQTQMGAESTTHMIMVPEGDNTRVYVSDSSVNQWFTYTMTPDEALESGLTTVDPMNAALQNLSDDANITLRDLPASPETGGEPAYELTIEMPPAALTQIVQANAGGVIESFEGTGTVVYVVAADDGQPFSTDVEISGVMTAGGESGDFYTRNSSTFSNWNSLAPISVPQEALGATEIEM